MTPQQFLDHLSSESARFASAAAGAPAAAMNGFGDWRIRDMVVHLGQVYATADANVAGTTTEMLRAGAEAQPPDGDGVMEWFAARRNTLLTSLGHADPEAPAGSFAGPVTNAWWARRMAQETTVHRWDVEAAVAGSSDADPIDSDLAADGIDEYLSVGLRFSMRRPDRVYPSASLHLHRSDGPGEWMLVGNDGGDFTVTHEHGKGDAAVRGSASSLLLWVWGRPVGDVEIFGDPAVAATWQALAP